MEGEVQFLIKKPAKNVGAVDWWEQLVRQSAEKVIEVLYWCLCVEREGREVAFVESVVDSSSFCLLFGIRLVCRADI